MDGAPCRVQGFMIFPGVPTTFPDYSTPFPTTPSMLAELNQGVAQAYSGHNGTNIMDKTVSFLVRTNNYARRTICGGGKGRGVHIAEKYSVLIHLSSSLHVTLVQFFGTPPFPSIRCIRRSTNPLV